MRVRVVAAPNTEKRSRGGVEHLDVPLVKEGQERRAVRVALVDADEIDARISFRNRLKPVDQARLGRIDGHLDTVNIAPEKVGQDAEFLGEIDDGCAREANDFAVFRASQEAIHEIGALVVSIGLVTEGGGPAAWHDYLEFEFALLGARDQIGYNGALHETPEIVDFVNDNDRIVEMRGVLARNLFQFRRRYTIVTDEFDAAVDGLIDLLLDEVLLLGGQGIEIRLGGGLVEIGDP